MSTDPYKANYVADEAPVSRTKNCYVVTAVLMSIAVFMCGGGLFTLFKMTVPRDSGSPELGRQWADELASLSGPDDPRITADSGIEVNTLSNGDWLLSRCKSSHWDGTLNRRGDGTFVVRDNSSRTRVFFGHVCGADYARRISRGMEDLDSFYDRLAENDFTEFPLDPEIIPTEQR